MGRVHGCIISITVFLWYSHTLTSAQDTDQINRDIRWAYASPTNTTQVEPHPSRPAGEGRSLPPSRRTNVNITTANITAQLGSSVFLPCKTQHSMERQVSWVRRRDWHILTSGTVPYTSEEKFAVHHPEGSTEWTLAIKYVALDDAGTYECQIATGGGLVSHLVHLNVVAPRAVIPGNGEYHVETGSTISLDCFIEQSPEAPQYIFWYHNNRMINYDQERGGVSVRIDTGPKVRSRLKITEARHSDSGNYTCAAANTAPASITVYITEANKIAVIQPRAVDSQKSLRSSLGLVLIGVSAALIPVLMLEGVFIPLFKLNFSLRTKTRGHCA